MTIFCKKRPFFPPPLHFARNMLYTAFARKNLKWENLPKRTVERSNLSMSRKNSMKKKLAVALSVVNALNTVAPMALPYVNVTKDMSTGGRTGAPSGGR